MVDDLVAVLDWYIRDGRMMDIVVQLWLPREKWFGWSDLDGSAGYCSCAFILLAGLRGLDNTSHACSDYAACR